MDVKYEPLTFEKDDLSSSNIPVLTKIVEKEEPLNSNKNSNLQASSKETKKNSIKEDDQPKLKEKQNNNQISVNNESKKKKQGGINSIAPPKLAQVGNDDNKLKTIIENAVKTTLNESFVESLKKNLNGIIEDRLNNFSEQIQSKVFKSMDFFTQQSKELENIRKTNNETLSKITALLKSKQEIKENNLQNVATIPATNNQNSNIYLQSKEFTNKTNVPSVNIPISTSKSENLPENISINPDLDKSQNTLGNITPQNSKSFNNNQSTVCLLFLISTILTIIILHRIN